MSAESAAAEAAAETAASASATRIVRTRPSRSATMAHSGCVSP
nr:hypothetical protein [Actinomadura madurae]